MTGMRAAGAALVIVTLGATGCTTVRTPSKADPLEGVNRTIFVFNDKVDRAVLKPVAQGYVWAVPQVMRDGVSNFFANIGDVYTAANNYLQGNVTAGTEDVMRVAINTLFGVGGLIDVATQAKLPRHQQDFGLTLGHYGVPSGPYLVLPLLGPSTVRDAVGYVVDRTADPTTYINPAWARDVLYGIRLVNARAGLLSAGDLLADAALDKYSFVRNAYFQRRNYLINENRPGVGDADNGGALPAYEDVGPTPAESAGATPVPPGAHTGQAPVPPGGAGSGAAAGGARAGAAGGMPEAASDAQAAPAEAASGAAAPPAGAASATGTEGASGAQAAPATPASSSGEAPGDSNVPAGQMMPPANYLPGFRLR